MQLTKQGMYRPGSLLQRCRLAHEKESVVGLLVQIRIIERPPGRWARVFVTIVTSSGLVNEEIHETIFRAIWLVID